MLLDKYFRKYPDGYLYNANNVNSNLVFGSEFWNESISESETSGLIHYLTGIFQSQTSKLVNSSILFPTTILSNSYSIQDNYFINTLNISNTNNSYTEINQYNLLNINSSLIDNSQTQQEQYFNILFSLNNIDGSLSNLGQYNQLLSSILTSSNSNSFQLSTPIINSLLYTIANSYTENLFNLQIQSTHLLSTVCEILSQTQASVRLNLNCILISESETDKKDNLSLLYDIQTLIQSKTSQFGSIVSNFDFNVEDSNKSSQIVSFVLTTPLNMVSSTLSALVGTLNVSSMGDEISISVYINTRDQHNLQINRAVLNDFMINRNKNMTLHE